VALGDYFAPGLTEDGGSDNPTTDEPTQFDSTGTVTLPDGDSETGYDRYLDAMYGVDADQASGGPLIDGPIVPDWVPGDGPVVPDGPLLPEGPLVDGPVVPDWVPGDGPVTDGPLPDWVQWVTENSGTVLTGVMVLVALFLLQPVLGIVENATGG